MTIGQTRGLRRGSGLSNQINHVNWSIEHIKLGQKRRRIIAHYAALVRVGYAWFAAFCKRYGTDLVIVNGDTFSPEQELVPDLHAIVYVFSARMFGPRS